MMEPTPPASNPSDPAPAATASTAPAAKPVPANIGIADFQKLDLRVGTVVQAAPHPNADRLLVLQVDLGGEQRQICAGVKASYSPEQLVGKQLVIVTNLEPRQLRGQVSQGMALAATDGQTQKLIMVSPLEPTAPGSKVS
jgi:methionyl-tRNA synthetase